MSESYIEDYQNAAGACVLFQPKDKDGAPLRLHDLVYGEDGRAWEVIGYVDKPHNVICKPAGGGKPKPLKAGWLTHCQPPRPARAIAVEMRGMSRKALDGLVVTGLEKEMASSISRWADEIEAASK